MGKSTLKPPAKGEKPESPERYQKDQETLLLQVKHFLTGRHNCWLAENDDKKYAVSLDKI